MTNVSILSDAMRHLDRTERRAFRQAARIGGKNYVRSRDLRRIIALRGDWLEDQDTPLIASQIRNTLLSALRAMVRAKRQETWHYSPMRHLAILQALAGEMRLAREHGASYAATAPPSGVDGSMAPVASPSVIDTPLGSA